MGIKAKANRSVPPPQLPENQKLRFSFEYYDGSKYCVSEWTKKDIKDALLRLREVCRMTFNDLRRGSRVYHFHEVDWNTTSEKTGFADPDVNQLQPFQFALLGINKQRARIYGAYSTGTFYIIWFDLNHSITPSLQKHT